MKDIKIYAMNFYYDCPNWLQNDLIKDVKITGECTSSEVDALLYGIMGFNDISLADTPPASLMQIIKGLKAGEIALSGGLIFQEDEKVIPPSCCCGLEEWQEIVADIRKKEKPWMGHDPFATCVYETNKIIVCSDDLKMYNSSKPVTNSEKEIVRIVFTEEEIETYFKQLELDMENFTMGPLARRILELAPALQESFCSAWLEYFLLRNKEGCCGTAE